MSPELEAANTRVTSAKSALTAAQAKVAELEKADPKDDDAIAAAKTEVEDAQSELTEAEAAVLALGDGGGGSADDLLADALGKKGKLGDGTPSDKDIRVNKEKFDDLNEKAKLLDQFAPILAKLQKDPELAKKLMAGDDPNASIQERLKALEDREKAVKTEEVTTVITSALKTWPEFRKHWDAVKSILPGLEAQGVPYADAVQRAYFAVNPEAAVAGKKIVQIGEARRRENDRGRMSAPGGGGPRVHATQEEDGYQLSEADLAFARATGLDPKLYAKHAAEIARFADL